MAASPSARRPHAVHARGDECARQCGYGRALATRRRLPAVEKTPVLATGPGAVSQSEFANERDILYKLFFDMKKDVNELKKMFFDLLQNQSLSQHSPVFTNDNNNVKEFSSHANALQSSQPVFIHHNNAPIQQHEEVEESLSIVDKEKEDRKSVV